LFPPEYPTFIFFSKS